MDPESLENISFTAVYREIIANLLLCPEHRPADNCCTNTYSSLISINPFFTSCNVVSYTRNRFSQNLVGTLNDQIRQKLLENYYDCHLSDSSDTVEPLAFFDCVLDENILDLSAHIAFPNSRQIPNFSKLIEIISIRSPFIRNLLLNFKVIDPYTSLDAMRPLIPSLSCLYHLTSLSLFNLNSAHRSILIHVGRSCPKLVSLSISKLKVNSTDIFAIIAGENATTLEKEADELKENELHMFKLAFEFLTPICQSIQHLQLELDSQEREISSVTAFLLRQMPKLQTFSHFGTAVLSYAIQLLNQISSPTNIPLCCPKDALLLERSSYFSGHLSLTELEYLDICDEGIMEAVQLLCPKLEKVKFFQDGRNTTPTQFGSPLKHYWPNVENITFSKVTAVLCTSILRAFEKDVVELTYLNVSNISILDLMPCTKLKSLRILYSSSLANQQTPPPSLVEHFLPCLKNLESDICLKNMSALFEAKESYTHLSIACCHLVSKESEWNHIPKLWPFVQILKIQESRGLNVNLASHIFLRFHHLKSLGLRKAMICKGNTAEKDIALYQLKKKLAIKNILF